LPLGAPILAVIGLSRHREPGRVRARDVILGQNDENRTLAVGLSRYILAGFSNRWGVFAAGALIAAVPVVAVFLFLQRSSSRG
jgi:arabinogalactan oligomer/maltooligosaccharide transport system permease protein